MIPSLTCWTPNFPVVISMSPMWASLQQQYFTRNSENISRRPMKIFYGNMKIFHLETWNMKILNLETWNYFSDIVPGAVCDEDQVGVFPARARHLEDALAVGLCGGPVRGTHQVVVTSTHSSSQTHHGDILYLYGNMVTWWPNVLVWVTGQCGKCGKK